LAPQLLNASEPPLDGPGGWFLHFNTWSKALNEIDIVVKRWQEHFRPFLDVRRGDYENCDASPPANIRTEQTISKYKTLCLVHPRYEIERQQIFSYFEKHAAELAD
jgi:hypothetical protein